MQNFGIDISSFYLYDASGERVWKLTGPELQMQINAQTVYTNLTTEKTLYASPLMVMTDKEYTKHYYVEGERVCSKLGGGFGPAPQQPTGPHLTCIEGDLPYLRDHLKFIVRNFLDCTYYEGQWNIEPVLQPAHNTHDDPETKRFFYHSDHLGSSSFITNIEGRADQHIQYLPFGELFVNQSNNHDFDSRYKFTAKELDNETNYTYFGARYYDSDLSSWLSVDPMADDYPSISPYMYVAGNPIRLIDPDGEKIYIIDPETGKKHLYIPGQTKAEFKKGSYVFKVAYTLDRITNSGNDVYSIVQTLSGDETTIVITEGIWNERGAISGLTAYGGTIPWSPHGGAIYNTIRNTPARILLHELGHVFYEKYDPEGILKTRPNSYLEQIAWEEDMKDKVGDYHSYSDRWLIQNVEPHFGVTRPDHSAPTRFYYAKTPFSKKEKKNKSQPSF